MVLKDLKFDESKIVEYRNTVKKNPLVSVITVTYNQEKYISQCLDSILGQKTDFDIELIIGEDESTDDTRKICRMYADKYPSKVRLIEQSRDNVIKINGKPTGRFNLLYCLSQANGKYIAFCEGDDYWIDENKLQHQVEVLENHSECSLVFTNFNKLIDDGNSEVITPALQEKNTSILQVSEIKNIIKQNYIATCTVMMRNWFTEDILPENFNDSPMGDWPLWLLSGNYGKYYFNPDITANYRIHAGGVWSMKPASHSYKSKIQTLRALVVSSAFDKEIQLLLNKEINVLRIKRLKALFQERMSSLKP